MSTQTPLIAELRRRIKDVRFSQRAMGLGISDSTVTSALAEVSNGRLMVTIVGGPTTPSVDIDLTQTRYDTIGRLYQALSRIPGYRVSLDEDANTEHVSIDLEEFGPMDIARTGLDIKHRLFSDVELTEVLTQSVARHNPGYSIFNLPPQEHVFVLMLAQSQVCRIQAFDAAKRRGMDKDVSTLLALAKDLEDSYTSDVNRVKKALQPPREANPNLVGTGDLTLGKQFKRSLRTGFMSPISQGLPPSAPVLLDPDERDVEDTNARIRWERNRDMEFFSFELWMDTQPEVQRSREGIVYVNTPYAQFPSIFDQEDARRYSSTMVFRSFGPNSNFNRSTFSTFVEEFGQLMTSYVVPNLEPESVYYFRLYVVDLNYEAVGSNVLAVRTKPLRCRFPQNGYVNKYSGPVGTVVTVNFDPKRAPFTANQILTFGNKEVVPTIIAPYQATFVVPTFVNTSVPKDLVVTSPGQLVDVRREVFQVTS